MPTPFVPLRSIQAWYDVTPGAVPIYLYLLDASVTSMIDSYADVTSLPGLLATTGSYNATTGISAGSWPLHYDSGAGVLELSLPAIGWVSTATYSLTFRWIALAMGDGTLLSVVDYGSAQTLSAAHLQLYATESIYIPGSFPVYRWRKA